MTDSIHGGPVEASSGRPGTGRSVLHLLRKDRVVFYLGRRVAVFGVFVLAALQVVYVDEVYFILGVLLASSLAVYVPVVEWFQETDQMLHSLPIDRDAVVLARYLAAVLTGALAGIVWNLTGRILLPLLRAGGTEPAMWMTLEGGLTFVLVVGLMTVLFFPLYFRMGLGKSAVAFLGLSLALLFLAYATAGLAGGPGGDPSVGLAGGPAGPGPSFGAVPLVPPSALIRTRVFALLGSLGVAGTLALILVSLAVAFYASIRLSQRWLREREF